MIPISILKLVSFLYTVTFAFSIQSQSQSHIQDPTTPVFPIWPFYRQLALGDTGRDVLVLNRILAARALEWCFSNPPTSSSIFDTVTKSCLSLFQDAKVKGVTQQGVLDAITAFAILEQLGEDSYVDSGIPPFQLGYFYKVLIHLPSTNRSVEATAHLIAGNGTELFNFTVRLHGAENYPTPNWPSYNNSDSGLSEFASDGATPTGLAEFDLNSPESNASEFGPYPINRAVRGLEGNWAILMTNDNTTLRDGILLHTGEWPNWSPPMIMPNSLGCIHAWPESIHRVWQTLVGLGVKVRKNTNGDLPYPYQSQGLLSIACPLCNGW